MGRLLLAFGAAALTLLLTEAGHSLVTGRSLFAAPSRGSSRAPEDTVLLGPPTDAERHAGAEGSGGIYRIHEDPRVRYVLRSDTELRIVDSVVQTDALGLRKRPGPPPAEDAVRIAVLGDSVAFGYGVNDDETLAAHLERVLTESRGPEARPVACATVAVPSWNLRAELAFVTDHWDAVHADVVVCLPIPNDLGDAGAIYESGKLRLDTDPAQADPWLLVSRSLIGAMEKNLDHSATGRSIDDTYLGPCALECDITPESRRRYDDNVASLVALDRLLAGRGSRLVVAFCEQSLHAWHLAARLAHAAPELPVVWLHTFLPEELTLVVDPHPSSATHAVRARWLAEELLARGLVEPGAGRPLPDVPEAHAALRGQDYDRAELDRRAQQARLWAREALLDEVDLVTGKGLRQIVGGLNVDRSVRMHALVAVKAGGPELRLVLAPVAQRRDLYPLRVDVELNGEPAGSVVIKPLEQLDVTLPVPPSIAPGDPLEVGLRPANWCVMEHRGSSQVVAFRLLRIACPAP